VSKPSIASKKQMRILYDLSVMGAARVATKGRTGVFRVVDAVARYLLERSDIEVSWTAYGNCHHLKDVIELCKDDPSLSRPVVALLRTRSVIDFLSSPIEYLASTHFYKVVHPALPVIKRWKQHATFNESLARGFDIVHNPFTNAIPKIDESSSRPVRFVTAYDLIPILYPEFFITGIAELQTNTFQSLCFEDWVLCISESTRTDLLAYRPDLDPEKIRVTPLAAAEHFTRCHDRHRISEVRSRLGIPIDASYFLSVCTLEPRKNLRHLIAVFKQMLTQLDEKTYLVLVGAKGWHVDELLREVTGETTGRVIVTGYVSDEDLAPLYSDAIAFVYPTLYEGFGLPPLEAMQCGTPVIASHNSSLPEVVGDSGILIDAKSREELASAILRLYQDDALRQSLSHLGLQRAKKFTWERCGELTVQAYHDALQTR